MTAATPKKDYPPATLDVALVALSWISPNTTRLPWAQMGMALKAEFGEAAKDGFIDWSTTGEDYNALDTLSAWKSFKGAAIGIGSLFARALAEGFKFEKSTTPVSPEKIAADKAARAARNAKTEANRIRGHAAAAVRAASQLRMASATGESPYLVRKLVEAEACSYTADGGLILPIMDYAPDVALLRGKQAIDADGNKKYSSGMNMQGGATRLGAVPLDGDDIGLVEGYATGLSVRMATDCDFAVFVGFDAGNLVHVARMLRAKYPSSRIVIFADDDYLTKHAGQLAAQAAADAVGNALVVLPVITAPRRATKNDESLPKLTDFNDLHCAQGLNLVNEQILAALAAPMVIKPAVAAPAVIDLGPSANDSPVPPWMDDEVADSPAPPVSDDPVGISIPTDDQLIAHFALIWPTTNIWDGLRKQLIKRSAFNAWVGKDAAAAWEKNPKRRTVLRDSLPALQGGRAIEGGAGGGKLGEMLDNITLLRGTETVWDAIGQQVMTLGAVRADYTPDMTSKWQEHALRKTVEAKNLVFDPTQRADPETHVNIFLGWPLTPRHNPDLVKPIIALLESLCSGEDNVDECLMWILCWLAYPLQNPGAKMQTALLMFGEKQGTGKSLLFQDVIAPIYGEYGTVASQHQLDSSFTAWRSRKLFVLFEEVLSREDKYSHNGTLKYMITGSSMSVNQKNLPERTEANHMNAVFLSNEPQPIPIELEDRRFFVIEARKKQPEAFYSAVKESIARGGIEAFYQFLLDFPMEGFNEHTKPLMTLAKERVIEFGLNGWMSFHRSWKDGHLSAPYCSCLSEDLYTIYRRWCDKSGEKALTLCKFAGFIGSREHKVKRSVCVGPKGKASRMIIEIKAENEKESVDKQIDRFRTDGDVRGTGMQA